MFVQLADNLWIRDGAMRLPLVELPLRMTVVRHENRLLLHSPIPWQPEIRDKLATLGEVATVVAPNAVHHLYAGNYTTAYENAQLWGAPGLPEKRPDLRFAGVLDDRPLPGWEDVLAQHVVGGMPRVNETAFLHRPSGTLILTDLLMHLSERSAPLPLQALAMLSATWKRPAVPPTLRWLLVRDRAALRRSIEIILGWDFDRIVLSHGDVIVANGKVALREAYGWLL